MTRVALGRVVGRVTLAGVALSRVVLAFLLIFSGVAAHAATWSDLWSTHEQQAQHLLDSKQPAQAAALFGDPRRRAYADLQAGKYDEAAKLLAPFQDVDSQYNRGNALAHTGKLKDALAAYDSALSRSPANQDAKRNRDLVKRALEQQSQKDQKSNGGNSQSGGKGDQGDKQGQAKDGQSSNGQSNAGQPKGGQSSGDPSNGSGSKSPSGSAGDQQKDQRTAEAQSQQSHGQNGQQTPGQQDNPGQQGGQSQSGADKSQGANQAQASNQAPAADETQAAGQPQTPTPTRSAEAPSPADLAGNNSQRAATQSGDAFPNKAMARAAAPPEQPRSEQALSLDQWLRGIPEDSGELLRRKFMIEHMMKQQGSQP
jgi:Ca-activated chloride channel family protein